MKLRKVILIGALIPFLVGCNLGASGAEDHILKSKDYYVECDKKIILEPSKFFNESASRNISIDDVTIDSTLMTNSSKYEYDEETRVIKTKGQDFLEIGEYEITLNYKNKIFSSAKLIVQDSTPPRFTRFVKNIFVEKGAENLDLSKYFRAVDEHWVTITIHQTGFDKDVCDDYKIKITVEDKYGNSETRKSTVHVVPLSTVDAGNVVLTSYANGSTPRAHRHTWIKNYKTVHHDAVYETKEVVDNEAYDEEVEKKIEKEVHICNGCGKDITEQEEEHFASQKESDINTKCTTFTTKTIEASGGTETVHHDKKTHTEKVEVEPAYDEKIEIGWICEDCKKTKS